MVQYTAVIRTLGNLWTRPVFELAVKGRSRSSCSKHVAHFRWACLQILLLLLLALPPFLLLSTLFVFVIPLPVSLWCVSCAPPCISVQYPLLRTNSTAFTFIPCNPLLRKDIDIPKVYINIWFISHLPIVVHSYHRGSQPPTSIPSIKSSIRPIHFLHSATL